MANITTTSPRISFSHDFSDTDTVPVEQLIRSLSPSSSSSSSSPDFNFFVQQNPNHHHADELFSNGKIITSQLKQHPQQQQTPQQQSHQPQQLQNSKHLQQLQQQETQQNNSTKSFWGFKRSSSCGNGYAKSLCPIPLLSKSHSTGSSACMNTKRSSKTKGGCASKPCSNFQKPPLRKTSYSYGNNVNAGNGVRINPVLNLGFGSLFLSGKKK